jgi:hypothetical protein
MPPEYGEESEPLTLAGEVSVTIGEASHTVSQLITGDQSKALDTLASDILAVARRRAKRAVTASSLAEGLQKLTARQLGPEALELVVLRRRVTPGPSDAEDSWLLHLTGPGAEVRVSRPEGGYGAPLRWRVPGEEFRKLVAVLRDSDLAGIPQNLDAPDYTDLRIQVLDQVKNVMARRYANRTTEAHSPEQAAFDRILEQLQRLVRRALQEGREASEPDARKPASPSKSRSSPLR